MSYLRHAVVILIISVAFYNIPKIFETKLAPIVEGFFQPEFMDVAIALRNNMESGKEQGAAFAVYHGNEPVIDMWAGYADRESMRRWRNDTTTLAFDCTKGVMAVLVALMVDQGLLNYSRNIADYWPEFGVNGKEDITLEMFLSHQAGLPYLSEQISLRDLQSNLAHVVDVLVEQKPVWTPGTQLGYHELTYGLYLDRIIQKADLKHREVAQIFLEEIATPLDIEFDLNLKREFVYKTARLYVCSRLQAVYQSVLKVPYLNMYLGTIFRSDSILVQVWNSVKEYMMPFIVFNDPELREITMSSFSGTGTARGLAKLFSIISTWGNFHGQQVMSREVIEKLYEPLIEGTCNVTGFPLKFGRGLQVFKNPYGETVYGHSGYGGQVVIADPKNKLTLAYLTNYFSIYRNKDDTRFLDLQKAVYANFEKYLSRKERTKIK